MWRPPHKMFAALIGEKCLARNPMLHNVTLFVPSGYYITGEPRLPIHTVAFRHRDGQSYGLKSRVLVTRIPLVSIKLVSSILVVPSLSVKSLHDFIIIIGGFPIKSRAAS